MSQELQEGNSGSGLEVSDVASSPSNSGTATTVFGGGGGSGDGGVGLKLKSEAAVAAALKAVTASAPFAAPSPVQDNADVKGNDNNVSV